MENNIHNIIDNIYSSNDNFSKSLDNDKNSETESFIDTTWLENYNRLYNLSNIPEKEFMNDIGIYFIYINKNYYIEKILFEKHILEKDIDFSFLSKESVLKIIQTKKITTPTSKYKLIDILLFNIDIDHNELDQISNKSLMNIPIFNNIQINKSIFIFHNINNIYFIFKEIDNNQLRTTLKSILKNTSSQNTNKEEIDLKKKVNFIQSKKNFKKINHFTKKNRNNIFIESIKS
jgi:hypothetical protein